MIKKFLIAAMLVSTFGCTSFRTTALYRFANDSVVPQKTNKKLKGLPVKLKVPSHVQVTVYEQQVILATSKEALGEFKETADSATVKFNAKDDKIKNLSKNFDAAKSSREQAERISKQYSDAIELANQRQNAVEAARAMKLLVSADEVVASAMKAEEEALAALNNEPKERAELRTLKQEMDLAVRNATAGYTLLSFTPAQYVVERELQYTDKVFLVDFKRPAGGILNLTEASMDDEQYFSKVQAEITERTLEDVGYALKTIADPLSKLGKKQQGNTAIPTSSETPVAETNNNINFQKSVIATQRFDISEAGWEERLQAFVSEFIAVDNGQAGFPGNPVEMPLEYSDGPVFSPVYDGHSGVN